MRLSIYIVSRKIEASWQKKKIFTIHFGLSYHSSHDVCGIIDSYTDLVNLDLSSTGIILN